MNVWTYKAKGDEMLYVYQKGLGQPTCWTSHDNPSVVVEHFNHPGERRWADHFELGASVIRAMRDESDAKMFGLVPPALAVQS
jgi:hypothetical protein